MLNHITHREIKQDINHIIGKWDKCPVKIITVPLLTLQHDITQKYIRTLGHKFSNPELKGENSMSPNLKPMVLFDR